MVRNTIFLFPNLYRNNEEKHAYNLLRRRWYTKLTDFCTSVWVSHQLCYLIRDVSRLKLINIFFIWKIDPFLIGWFAIWYLWFIDTIHESIKDLCWFLWQLSVMTHAWGELKKEVFWTSFCWAQWRNSDWPPLAFFTLYHSVFINWWLFKKFAQHQHWIMMKTRKKIVFSSLCLQVIYLTTRRM